MQLLLRLLLLQLLQLLQRWIDLGVESAHQPPRGIYFHRPGQTRLLPRSVAWRCKHGRYREGRHGNGGTGCSEGLRQAFEGDGRRLMPTGDSRRLVAAAACAAARPNAANALGQR